MKIEISKTNYELLMKLIDKAVEVIRQKQPTPREYNVARRLYQVKKLITKTNK